jgi:hypothetical protein
MRYGKSNGLQNVYARVIGDLYMWLPLSAQVSSPKMTFNRSIAFAVSAPLRELANLPGSGEYGFLLEESLDHPTFHPHGLLGATVDPAEQSSPGSPSSISIGLNLAGLNESDCNCCQERPDTNAAIGDNQVVECVNVEYEVYDKRTGTQELGPVPGNQLWQSLGGPCYENIVSPFLPAPTRPALIMFTNSP